MESNIPPGYNYDGEYTGAADPRFGLDWADED